MEEGDTMSSVLHVPAGEGEKLWVTGDTVTLKTPRGPAGRALALIEVSVAAGNGPPPHVHKNEDEAYYVLDGELEILAGDRTFVARAGSYVFIPRGTLHRFRNVGYGHARMLALFTPSGFEEFFRAAGTEARPGEPPQPLDEAEIARTGELAPRYGMEVRFPEAVPA
jgi:quercetin dioxygenase-like cupin family protein